MDKVFFILLMQNLHNNYDFLLTHLFISNKNLDDLRNYLKTLSA